MNPRGIILIQSDQHRADCLGVSGHSIVKTPHLDRLASEGIIFREAYCPSPVCVPARTSLLCGRWPLQHGAVTNFDSESSKVLQPDADNFAKTLKAHGLSLDFIGRWHVHPRLKPTDFGFDSFTSDSGYGAWRIAKGAAPVKCGWQGAVDHHIKPEESRLHWLTDILIAIMRRRIAEGGRFFISMDIQEPHLPNLVPEPYASMYPPESIPPWGSFSDDFKGKPYIQRQQLKSWGIEDMTWDEWAKSVSLYLGQLSLIDAQIGRVLAELDRLGASDEVLLVYTSDHGDMCGGHRMLDKHFIMYDDVVKVPLLMRCPALIKAGLDHEGFVSSAIDLAATFCAAMGAAIPASFSGKSLMPCMAGETKPIRDDILCTYCGNQFGLFSQRMVRNKKWKYVWNATAEDELYDLSEDRHELKNLAASEKHATILGAMRKRLWEWMEETRDPLRNEWIRRQLRDGKKI